MKTTSIDKVALLLLLALLWGASYPLTKASVNEIPMMTFSLGRTVIGAFILWQVMRLKGQQLPGWNRIWIHLSVMALVHNAAPYALLAWGSKTVDSGLASIITSTAPLFTIILSHYMVADDRMTTAKLIGVLVAVGGMVAILSPSFQMGTAASLKGIIAILAASVCYGVANVYTRKYLSDLPSLVGPTGQLIVASAFLLPASLLLERPYLLPIPSVTSLLTWIAAAVLCTGVAFIVFYRLIAIASPSYVSMVSYLIPIVGAGLGVLVLGERLTWPTYLGFAIILAGVMITNLGPDLKLTPVRYFIRQSKSTIAGD